MIFTLEESTTERVSPLLYDIVQNIYLAKGKCCDSVQKDLFNVLCIVLMIENGFLPVKDNTQLIKDVKTIDAEQLQKWKTPLGVLEVMFVLNGFENIPLKLITSPLGATALVNLVILDLDSETYSACMPVSRYVVSAQASTIPMIFRDLKHFSVTFKNKVLTPVKSKILGLCGFPGASLVGLPEDVLRKINLQLSGPDVARVGQTCRRMRALVDDQSLWHELYKRDFNGVETSRNDWKSLYREKFTEQCEAAARTRAAGNMHDNMDYADYVSYIDNPLWSSMII